MSKIFISYSRSKDIVEELVQDLHDDDHETWFDQRLTGLGGQPWWNKILSEIRTCDIFVAALTPDSLESRACQRELIYADLLQKPLCPVRLSDKVRPEALPQRLAELQWVDYSHRDKLAFKNLQRTIRGLPKAPALPDPLPDPPPVPISYLNTLRERVETDSPLEFKDQAQLVFELRSHFRDGGPAEEITDLLQRLKKRDELFAKVARDIDDLQGDINRGQRGSLSSDESEPLDGATSFTVILAAIGDKKIEVIKEVRAVTGLGLKEAKDLVEAAPKPVKEGATKEEAEAIRAAFEKVGAKVELKSNDTPGADHKDQVQQDGLDNGTERELNPDHSNRIGFFTGTAHNKTYDVQGKAFLEILSIEDSGSTVSASFGFSKGLHAKGRFVGSIYEEYRLELVGIISSLQTGSFDCRLRCHFVDRDQIQGEYFLEPRAWNFLSTKQNGELVLTRQRDMGADQERQ